MANTSSARPLWYLVLSVVGLGLSMAYWYPRLDPSVRDGWLRIVLGVFFGIVAPGLFLFAIVATIRLVRDKKKQSSG